MIKNGWHRKTRKQIDRYKYKERPAGERAEGKLFFNPHDIDEYFKPKYLKCFELYNNYIALGNPYGGGFLSWPCIVVDVILYLKQLDNEGKNGS